MVDVLVDEPTVDEPGLRRRWPKIVSIVVSVLALLFVGSVVMGNTDRLTFPDYLSVSEPVAPGDVAVVEISEGQCTGPLGFLEREWMFGRWRQTHSGTRRDEAHLWDLTGRSRESDLPCIMGQVDVPIPADVTWSPVAACTIDNECVRIEVVLE